MSDCSMSAMEPRTCGTCKNVRCTWLDCLHAANDSSYYMRCTRPDVRACEHYVDDPDSLQRRYERLAQVAREMLEQLRVSRNSAYGFYKRLLEGCGVTVDD